MEFIEISARSHWYMSEWNCPLCISVKGPTKTTFELTISLSFNYAGDGDKNVERRHRDALRQKLK